jgi:ABC-type dipeptide/oligopeptide/nickel transport system permease component
LLKQCLVPSVLFGLLHLLVVSLRLGWTIIARRTTSEDIHGGIVIIARYYCHWWLPMLL